MARVGIEAVHKTYGRGEVIRGITCDVADGEFLVLLGPSGCGKSTLLRMVAGLERISAGTVSIGDRVVNDLDPTRRNVAMVFQTYALYPHMTVFDNMAYGLRLRGLSRSEIDAKVRAAAATLELTPFLPRRPRELSGGQRQRVAMGRAIVREPDVFLFDEPLSNLDAKLRTQMRLEIRRLQTRLGVTSLYVTHDQVEAMTLADRILVMNAGVAEQVGTPLAVYARPASVFVAGFIGAPPMNLIPARATGSGVEAGGLVLPLRAPPGPVTLGVRPEHLTPRPDGPIALRVEMVEALGADTVVHGTLGGAALVARLPGTHPARPGDVVTLQASPEAWHLFDAETGRRIE